METTHQPERYRMDRLEKIVYLLGEAKCHLLVTQAQGLTRFNTRQMNVIDLLISHCAARLGDQLRRVDEEANRELDVHDTKTS